MLLYWSIFIYLLVFSYIEQFYRISTDKIKIIFYVTILFLFCLSFMRWERGTDWDAYYNMFTYGTFEERYEWGFVLFNKIINRFTNNYTIYLFFQSLIYYSVFVLVVNKTNKLFCDNKLSRCYFPILLFTFSTGFTGIYAVRSTIAYMICLLALTFICENKYIKYFICIIIAASFHKSAYLFLITFPIFWWNISKLYVSILFIFTFFITSWSQQIVTFLEFISLENFTSYVENDESRGSIIGITKWASFLALAVLLKPNNFKYYCNKLLLVFSTGLILFIWCQLFSASAQRFASLYLNSCILLIIAIINNIKEVQRSWVIIGITFFTTISLWSLLNSQYQDLYIPYKFFWDDFYVITY